MKLYSRINRDTLVRSIPRDIDLFICSVSFEERCITIPSSICDGNLKKSLIFKNKAESAFLPDEKIEKNAKLLKSILGENSTVVEISRNNPLLLSNKIQTHLKEMLDSQQKNIAIDITTFTHEALLIIFKVLFLLNKNHKKEIFLIYNHATDYSYNITDCTKKWLSKGTKEPRTIFGYPGISKPLNQTHLMVLVGIEAERTSKLIDYYEPSILSLGLGKDCEANVMLHPMHKEIYDDLFSFYHEVDKFHFSCKDPLETRDDILKQVNRYSNYNIAIVPMNNKISTIGAGLAAIENPTIQLCYSSASLYNTDGYSLPSGECSLIEL